MTHKECFSCSGWLIQAFRPQESRSCLKNNKNSTELTPSQLTKRAKPTLRCLDVLTWMLTWTVRLSTLKPRQAFREYCVEKGNTHSMWVSEVLISMPLIWYKTKSQVSCPELWSASFSVHKNVDSLNHLNLNISLPLGGSLPVGWWHIPRDLFWIPTKKNILPVLPRSTAIAIATGMCFVYIC